MTTTRETADHAELAIVAWAERGPESRELCDVQLFDALTDEEREAGWISEPLVTAAYAETLLSEIAALRVREAALIDGKTDMFRRATQAERQRDELRKAADAMMPLLTLIEEGLWEDCPYPDVQAKRIASLRTQIANQGADQ